MLAVAKLGAVVMPTTGALGPADLPDRIGRGGAGFVIANAADAAKFDDVAGDYTRIAVGAPVEGWHCLRRRVRAASARPFGARTTRGRPDADLLHLRHHEQAEAGGALPGQLPGRAPVDDGLDRGATRRRAPGDQLAGLGEARLELFLRAVDRRGDDLRLQLPPLRRRSTAAPAAAGPVSTRSARHRRCGAC